MLLALNRKIEYDLTNIQVKLSYSAGYIFEIMSKMRNTNVDIFLIPPVGLMLRCLHRIKIS